MRKLGLGLLLAVCLAGCCAPGGGSCSVGGAAPCGTATFLHQDGGYEVYSIYPKGVYLQRGEGKTGQ